MTILTGQIIYADQALTGTLRLKEIDDNTLIEIEVFNGYFTEAELQPRKYQAQLVSDTPDGIVPEFKIEIPDTFRVTWQQLLENPKKKRKIAIASQPPENNPLNPIQVERLRKIPPPDPNTREGNVEEPGYWDREEFIQPSVEEEQEEEEIAFSPPPTDRQTRLMLEMARRRQ